jgi:hypothetical protein
VWLPDGFWFSTGSLARHNLAANPQISMHLERGDQVVIGLQQHQAEDRERRLRILMNLAPCRRPSPVTPVCYQTS